MDTEKEQIDEYCFLVGALLCKLGGDVMITKEFMDSLGGPMSINLERDPVLSNLHLWIEKLPSKVAH